MKPPETWWFELVQDPPFTRHIRNCFRRKLGRRNSCADSIGSLLAKSTNDYPKPKFTKEVLLPNSKTVPIKYVCGRKMQFPNQTKHEG